MVGQGAHSGDASTLLSSTHGGGRDEYTAVFAPVGPALPLLAGAVPESFPLGWEVTVPGGNPHEDSIVFCRVVNGTGG